MTRLFHSRDLLRNATLGLATPPSWARTPDATLECSDEWALATDPHNERGEVCTAYFDEAQAWVERGNIDPNSFSEGWEYVPVLKGIRVEGGTAGNWTKEYLDRSEVEARLGAAWIADVEAMQLSVGDYG